MKQQDQCVEAWWAVRIGRHDEHSIPYFMWAASGTPRLFRSRAEARDACPPSGRVVRVVLTTTGETQ